MSSTRNGLSDVLKIILGSPPTRIRAYVRLMNCCRSSGFTKLARILGNRLKSHGLYISPKAEISRSVKFPHPTAIVIGEGVQIEDDVQIFQSVTLGGARRGDWKSDNYPTIARGAILFAGVVVAGKVRVGENSVVGANSVVLHDIPDNCTCVGAPARVVSRQFFHSEILKGI